MADKIVVGSKVVIGVSAYDGPEVAESELFKGCTGTVIKDSRIDDSADFVMVRLDGPNAFYNGRDFVFDITEVSLVV